MSLRFQNDTSALHHLWYESHKNLITSLCIETGNVDKIAEFTDKFLGPPQKLKQRRDPKKHTRPKSSYLYYCDIHRKALIEQLRAEGKNVVISEISKVLGKQWKALDDSGRKPFEQQAEKDRARYADEMQVYTN